MRVGYAVSEVLMGPNQDRRVLKSGAFARQESTVTAQNHKCQR